jgi:hypothetical protein
MAEKASRLRRLLGLPRLRHGCATAAKSYQAAMAASAATPTAPTAATPATPAVSRAATAAGLPACAKLRGLRGVTWLRGAACGARPANQDFGFRSLVDFPNPVAAEFG